MKMRAKYVYCIQSTDNRIGLCGKENGIRFMFVNHSDAKSATLLAVCPKCQKKTKRNKQ